MYVKLEQIAHCSALILYVSIGNNIYDYQKFLETKMKATVGYMTCLLRSSKITSFHTLVFRSASLAF